jgi:hypothetical protein
MQQYFKTKQSGFALVVGMLFLLVLTILGLVAMRSTQLELAMTTAVTRQEQAFDGADSARSLTREALYARINKAADNINLNDENGAVKAIGINTAGIQNREAPQFVIAPTAANTGCAVYNAAPAASVMTVSSGGREYVQGLNCYKDECMVPSARMQSISAPAVTPNPLFTRNYCLTPAQVLTMTGNTMPMNFTQKGGSDVSDSNAGEGDLLVGLLANGATADGAQSSVVAILAIPTKQ